MSDLCIAEAGRSPKAGAEPSTPKRQYTLKGVESEAIELVRSAATKDGMKIGAWVSKRLRQAAEESLCPVSPTSEQDPMSRRERTRNSLGYTASGHTSTSDTEILISGLTSRIAMLEDELKEQARTQRIILTRLVSQG